MGKIRIFVNIEKIFFERVKFILLSKRLNDYLQKGTHFVRVILMNLRSFLYSINHYFNLFFVSFNYDVGIILKFLHDILQLDFI